MKLSNKLNLPQAIVDAVAADPYSAGDCDYSITTLLKPPKIVALERKHADEIVEDAADRIWALYGQIVHSILERGDQTGDAEKRYFATVDGVRISGQIDLFTGGVIQDFKFVTAYKFKNGQAPQEFVDQLNMYAALVRLNEKEVKGLELVGMLRDWSKLEAKRDANYPQTQVIRVPIPMMGQEEALNLVKNRINLHKNAVLTLPNCSPEERWARPDVYAVMKTGRKTAVRLCDTEGAAKLLLTQADYYVEKRPGSSIRCENYCAAAPWCSQFKKSKE